MEKKRILSLLLSVLMLVTLVFPIGAFAEEEVQEPKYEEPVYEEPIVEEATVEETMAGETTADEREPETLVEEQSVVEETAESVQEVETAAVEEVVVEEDDAVEATAVIDEDVSSEEGYVLVDKNTVVYETASKDEEIGTFTESAVAYAVFDKSAENDNWVWIVFDADDTDLQSGYVQFGDVTVLTDAFVAQLTSSLVNARDYKGNPLPVVSLEQEEETADVEFVAEQEVIATAVVSITGQP